MSHFASVVPDVYMDRALTYAIPPELASQITLGTQVKIPLRGHLKKGYVVALSKESDYPKALPIHSLCPSHTQLPEDLFRLGMWMAKYYGCPLSQAFKVMVPSTIRKDGKAKEQKFVRRTQTREQLSELCKKIRERKPAQGRILEVMLKAQKGLLLTELLEQAQSSASSVEALCQEGALQVDSVHIDRSPLEGAEFFRTPPKTLNEEQKATFTSICHSLDKQSFHAHLLFGVTGSGKTEVYLQAIDHALKMDRSAIVLVPEISLTPQTVERFQSRFDSNIAVLHHRLSAGERFDEWNRIAKGEASIVIGARSAIFSPLPNLGLIIVDEEHESSYKSSERSPCYHARDLAIMRAHLIQGVAVLGSATPSLESFANAQKGKYILNELKGRADSAQLPKVTIVDMKREYERNEGYTNFSSPLLDALEERIGKGEQSILFLNRRGYHTSQFCQGCGHVMDCSHCSTSLTFHRGMGTLACHLCGYQVTPPPRSCPQCKSQDTMKYKGVGTEQVEKALHAIFPDVRTLRMDADTTKHKGSHERLLQNFRTGKADILVGTQMIAKGLHFPQVTLVGVLNCDGSLNIPDFRASESVFQLITQVSGRAGRGALAGEVIIQTLMPDNATIQMASQQDYLTFFESEVATRELFDYPPFSHLIKFSFSGRHEKVTEQSGEAVRKALMAQLPPAYEIHPTLASGHAKIKDRFRFQFLIKGPSVLTLNRAVEKVKSHIKLPSTVRMNVDVDPLSTFF